MEIFTLNSSNIARSKSLVVQIRHTVSQAMKLIDISKIKSLEFSMLSINRSINLTSMMIQNFRVTLKTIV